MGVRFISAHVHPRGLIWDALGGVSPLTRFLERRHFQSFLTLVLLPQKSSFLCTFFKSLHDHRVEISPTETHFFWGGHCVGDLMSPPFITISDGAHLLSSCPLQLGVFVMNSDGFSPWKRGELWLKFTKTILDPLIFDMSCFCSKIHPQLEHIFLMVEKGISVFFFLRNIFFFWTFESTWESVSHLADIPHNWQPGRQPQVYHRLQAIKVLQDRWKTSRFFYEGKGAYFSPYPPKV